MTMTCLLFHTRSTGMPAITDDGSSSAAELTVSFALQQHAREQSALPAKRQAHAPDNQREVRIVKVLVDLLQLQHHVVRHARLSEQHVELAGHAASDGVDAEAHVDTVRAQARGDVCNGVLRARDCGGTSGVSTRRAACGGQHTAGRALSRAETHPQGRSRA